MLVAMLASVAIVLNHASKLITEYNQRELQRNIHSVLEQNADTISMLIDKHKTLVESTAGRMAYFNNSFDETYSYIMRQQSAQSVYKFIRIGYIDEKGNAISSDGYKGNLGFRDYYQKSMQGEVYITPAIKSFLSPDHPYVNIISAPVRNTQGRITGVVFETIPNSVFSDALSRGVFAEFGSNALISNDVEVIACDHDSLLATKYSDLLIFAAMEPLQKRFSVWRERLDGSQNVTTMYFERDGGQYLHFTPIYLDNIKYPIHIAILLSQATVDAQTSNFKREIYVVLGTILLIAILGVVYYFIDIHRHESSRRKELENIVYVSSVTGGDNFRMFKRKLTALSLSGYLVYMDIREFEIIRSSHGVQKANDLIKKIWQLLEGTLHPNEIAGHVNNDYFIIFYNTQSMSYIEQRMYELNAKLAELSDAEQAPPLVAYFGLIPYQVGDDLDVSLSRANIAKQSIVNKRSQLYAVYGAEYTEAYLENTALEKSFDKNIAEKRFEVWYQPKFDCFTNEIIAAEALVRLRAEDGSLVPPGKFISLFEKDGLIRKLDEYVFKTVCELQKQRQEANKKLVPISVNLSRVSLYYSNVVHKYVDIISEINIMPELVPLEITESATANVNDIHTLMDHFARHGFTLHMDDFGHGYSSLSALNELPFSDIKIDKSLVDYIGTEHGDAMLTHIIALLRDLGLDVTAEGVETRAQVEFLKKLKCNCIQGYYYSKPVEYSEFNKMLHIF